jgi:hypothetical protein
VILKHQKPSQIRFYNTTSGLKSSNLKCNFKGLLCMTSKNTYSFAATSKLLKIGSPNEKTLIQMIF